MKATVGEAFGYYGRAASSLDPAKTGPFILQTLLILVAAPLLAATLYMSAGRMIEALSAQKFSCMSPRWMTRIYVLVDIACIITQFMGAGMMSSGDPSKLAASKTLIVGGLITQFVAVIFFILLCCRIHMKLRAEVWVGVVRWTSAFIAIEAIGVLLLIRNVVRAVEYLQGSGGFAPSDPCWPSATEWASFNETVAGRLIKAVPPASVCYPSEPNYDREACNTVLSSWTHSAFHSADPTSVDAPGFANNSCNPIYLNGTSITGDPEAGKNGCSIGNYPVYVVNATNAKHIQAALKFARDKNIRFTVKNTGHNGLISTGYGSLSVWTHNIKSFHFHTSFIPHSCNPTRQNSQMAATIGAGMQDGELFAKMAEHNAVSVGGTNNDVGVVGWATGGGHGFLTGEYGMGADNILQAEIITPTGDLITANECLNQDIFWAIRGGGGGTFGVILNLTIKAYPMPSMSFMGFTVTAKDNTSTWDWYKLVANMHREFDRLQDAGVHGYYTMSGSQLGISGSLMKYNVANGTADNLLGGLKRLLDSESGIASSSLMTQWIHSWYDLIKIFPVFESVGTQHSSRASRFIPRRALNDTDMLAKTLKKIGPQKDPWTKGMPNPSISGTMTGSRKPANNSLNPAWRDAVVHIITQQSWNDSLPRHLVEDIHNDITWNKGYALRQLAPDTGAYFNEVN
ncbi:hypothetical protein CNMCM5623_005141 [Aspergillus felis]|uniref:FAD-binding PCMH-type domain-containing protein n=1 Tax=Aspergillus felis TaxID=1287682 RepID=A0A8H6QG49_9EURO|nr:hypothetical protein CNMCM5623_005141 [Aspergillus felis]KAF7184342.1 hypothetical protein CNMCM7691_005094 [Aspergillus felis]